MARRPSLRGKVSGVKTRGRTRPLSVRAQEARERADALEAALEAQQALDKAREQLRRVRARR